MRRVGAVLIAGSIVLPAAAQVAADPATIETLVDRLADADGRPAAERELLAAGASAMPALLAVFGSAAEGDAIDARARACLDVLGGLGEAAAPAAPALLRWLRAVHDRDASLALVETIGRIAPYTDDRAGFEEQFVDVAFGERPGRQHLDFLVAALFAVSRISIDPRAPLTELLDIVARHENPGNVIRAAELLAERPAVAEQSVPVLRAALDRRHDGDLKFEFNYQNGAHSGSVSVGGDRSALVRLTLARALRGLRPHARHGAAVLVPLLRDGSIDERMRAVTALTQDPSPDAVPALIEALRSEHEPLVREAITALSTVGPEAKAAVPALRALTSHASAQVRVRAQAVLRSLQE